MPTMPRRPAGRVRCTLLATVILLLSATTASAAALESLSVSPTGKNGSAASDFASISSDGRYVVWESHATNLLVDQGPCSPSFQPAKIYLRDMLSGVTEAIADGNSAAVNTSGRYVAYFCGVDSSDLCVRDRVAASTDQVAVNGTYVDGLVISADGRFLAYSALHGSIRQIDVYDRCVSDGVPVGGGCVPGAATASVNEGGVAGDDWSRFPSMSADGRYVAFSSSASNLVAGGTNSQHVFLRDLQAHTTEQVDLGPGGVPSNCNPASIGHVGVSDDGRYVAFTQCPSNWVPQVTTTEFHIYVRDRSTATTELISKNTAGAAADFSSSDPRISGDGRYVVFESMATNLGSPDADLDPEIYLRDRVGGTTKRLTESASGMPSQYQATIPLVDTGAVSADGHRGVFASPATNLVAAEGDNGVDDVFYWSDCAAATYTCGDGNPYPGCEQCDDGNLTDSDGCDSTCRKTGCGSGVVTAGETCDDGNLIDGDGCDSNCTPTGCGNGIRTAGEGCDDGNTVDGDGCSATCAYEVADLIPGPGSSSNNCWHEWRTEPVPPRSGKGIPKTTLTCTDDDSACDFGASTGDHACTFHVALCLNIQDGRLPDCTPTDLEDVMLKNPKEEAPKDPVELAIRDVFETRFSELGACTVGACVKPKSSIDEICHVNADCDVVGGDGVCAGRFGLFPALFTSTNRCTTYMDVVLPLKQKNGAYSAANKTVELLADPTPDQTTGKLRKGDVDKLKLVCKPAP